MKKPSNGKGQKTAIQLAIAEARRKREEQRNEGRDFVSWKDIDKKGNLVFLLDGEFTTQKDTQGRPRYCYKTPKAILLNQNFEEPIVLEDVRLPDSTRMTKSIEEAVAKGHMYAMLSEHEVNEYEESGYQRTYHDFLFISEEKDGRMITPYFK